MKMSNKPVSLTLTFFGKSLSVKNDTQVLHAAEVAEMFRTIYTGAFGDKAWKDLIDSEIDKRCIDFIDLD